MFKKLAYFALAVGLIPLASGWITTPSVQASIEVDKAEVGKMAPDFNATDINGETIKLSDLKGKNVVLEWTNHQCPFVVKHYSTGNMQKVQKTATEDGAVWISIVSSAPGKQGNINAEEAMGIAKEKNINATTKILDPSGEIGALYNAKTTPHMYVINKEGVLAYAGAIDDTPSPNPSTVEGAKNFVLAALDDLNADRDVKVSNTVPYGCSVKY